MNILKSLLPLASAIAAALPAAAYTEWNDGNGLTYHIFSNGDAALYSVDSNKKDVTIPASITVNDVTYPITEWESCNLSNVVNLTIEMPLTEIPQGRFDGYRNLKSVTLPETLTTIGTSAFHNTGLESIEFPQSLTTIGDFAFSYSKLTYLRLPEHIISIGSDAFSYTPLEMVSYNAGNGAIEPYVFRNCSNLRTLIIGDKIERVGRGTVEQYKYGNGWEWKDYLTCEEAFVQSPLTDVYIDNPEPPAWYMNFVESGAEWGYASISLTSTDKKITLHVPASAQEQYSTYTYSVGSYFQTQPPYNFYKDLSITPYSTSVENARFKRIEGAEDGFIAPEAITVSGPEVIATTSSVQLSAEVLPANTNMRNLIWHSDNPSIVAVNQDGIVNGIAVGEALIYAESPISGVKSNILRIAVENVSPTDFTLDRYADPLVIGIGGSYKLTPVYTPEICSEGLTYESTDPDIATVDATGTVKAIRRGICTIFGVADYGGVTRKLQVTVVPTASDINIIPLETNPVAGGEPVRMKAEVLPAASADEIVIWSAEPGYESFTITPDGVLTPLSHGSGYVTARTPDGCEKKMWVNIDYAQASGIIMPESMTLEHLEIAELDIAVEPVLAEQKVTLTSDNPQVVALRYNNSIIGLAAGEAVVTATDMSGRITASMKVVVNPAEYTVNLSTTEMRFDDELKPLDENLPVVTVCPQVGLELQNSNDVSVISSHTTSGYELSVTGTEPEEYMAKLAAAGFHGYGYNGYITTSSTFCDVSPYWVSSDESVAKVYPILRDYQDYYHYAIKYAPYATTVAIIPQGSGTATITYNPNDGSDVTATCKIAVGTNTGAEIVDSRDELIITTVGNRILVTNPNGVEIAVYNTAGTPVARGDSQQFSTPGLPSGIYIVATSEGATKVAI